jgi:hypothetical protein
MSHLQHDVVNINWSIDGTSQRALNARNSLLRRPWAGGRNRKGNARGIKRLDATTLELYSQRLELHIIRGDTGALTSHEVIIPLGFSRESCAVDVAGVLAAAFKRAGIDLDTLGADSNLVHIFLGVDSAGANLAFAKWLQSVMPPNVVITVYLCAGHQLQRSVQLFRWSTHLVVFVCSVILDVR